MTIQQAHSAVGIVGRQLLLVKTAAQLVQSLRKIRLLQHKFCFGGQQFLQQTVNSFCSFRILIFKFNNDIRYRQQLIAHKQSTPGTIQAYAVNIFRRKTCQAIFIHIIIVEIFFFDFYLDGTARQQPFRKIKQLRLVFYFQSMQTQLVFHDIYLPDLDAFLCAYLFFGTISSQ